MDALPQPAILSSSCHFFDGISVQWPIPGASREMLKSADAFFNEIYLELQPCACCTALRRIDKLKSTDAPAKLHLHSLAIGQQHLLCSKCFRFKSTAERPLCPFRPANIFAGVVPPQLQHLSWIEQMILRRVHVFHKALLVLPGGQQGARGQLVQLPADTNQMVSSLLPITPRDDFLR